MEAPIAKARGGATRRHFGGVVVFCAIMAFLAQLVISSRFTDLHPALDVIRLASIGVILATSLIGVGFCLTSKTIGAGLVSILFLIAVPFWVYLFDQRTAQPFLISSGGNYYGLGLVGLFIALTRVEGGAQRFLRAAFVIGLLYGLAYVILAPLLSHGILHPVEGGQLMRAEDLTSGRGARATIATAFIAFPLCVAIARLAERINYQSILTILICLVALWFAQSRLFSALVLAVLVIFMITRHVRMMGTATFLMFLLIALLSVVVIYSSFNPFAGMEGDQSAWARQQGIDIVHRLIGQFWFLGAGIAAGDQAYQPLTGVNYFYPADLGMVGHYFSFGIPGLLTYVAVAFGACFSAGTLMRLGVQRRFATGMGLTGIILSLYSMLAPVFSGGNATALGAFFLALLPYSPLIGFWQRRSRSVMRAAPTPQEQPR